MQSHTTLDLLELTCTDGVGYTDLVDDPTLTNLPQLMEIADNSRLVLIVEEGYYKYLPVPDEDDIDEQHDENDDNDSSKG